MKLPSQEEFLLLRALGSDKLSTPELKARHAALTGRVIPHGTIYTALSRLKGKGWLKIETGRDDKRTRRYKMTPIGAEKLKHLEALKG